jgi:hypothetical protein
MHEQEAFTKSLTILKDIVERCPNAAVSHAAQELYWSLKAGYKPSQARVPAGRRGGGQWTREGDGQRPDSTDKTHKIIEHSRTMFTIRYPDGSSEVRNGGTRAWRNNNPGNIRSGSFANRHGAIGSAGGMAVFPDEATGEAAQRALLRGSTYRDLTVDQAIARRSPPNENDTAHTQLLVRQFSGLSGKERIRDLNKDQLNRLSIAIRRTEGWKPGTITRYPAP